MIRSAALVCCALASAGCIHLNQQNPRPNIDLDKSSASLRLEFTSDVPDEFTLPPQLGNAAKTEVRSWQGTLRNGFKNGFGSAYPITETPPSALTLELADAELTFVMNQAQGSSAQIRFKARLLDAQGQVQCRSTGTALSKPVPMPDMSSMETSAVESMYEGIAQECFVRH